MANYSMVSSSLNTSYSGSIVKLLALGLDDGESTLNRVEWGNYSYPDSSFTPTAITDCRGCGDGVDPIKVPAGSYIEGPIGQLKVGAGGFLVYIND